MLCSTFYPDKFAYILAFSLLIPYENSLHPRSFSLNMEVSTFVIDRGMVAMLDEVCAEYEQVCTELLYTQWAERPRRIKIAENLCRLWSSLL